MSFNWGACMDILDNIDLSTLSDFKRINEKLQLEIDERKKLEQAMEEKQRHYEALLKALPIGLYQINADGNMVYVNEQTCELTGLKYEQILNFGWVEALHPEDREKVLNEWERCRNKPDIFVMEERLLRPDGSISWVISHAVPYIGLNGQVWFIGTLFDISSLKRAEIALRNSEEFYRMIFENSPLGIVHFNQEGVINTVNNRFQEIMGSTREAYIGFNILKNLKDKRMKESIKEVLDGKVVKYEGVYDSVAGNKAVPLKAIYGQAISVDGAFLGGIGIFEDLSEQWEAREALKKSEEQYRMIFNNSPLGIAHFDQNGIITHLNNSFIEIMGSSKEKLLGFNMIKEIRDVMMKSAVQTALKGRIGCYEGNYLSVTGNKLVPLRATYSSVLSDMGTFLGGICVCEDITERIQAEEALRKSETYNNLILNEITELVALYEVVNESKFRFLKINKNLIVSLGSRETDLIGEFIEDVVPANVAKKWVKNLKEVVNSRKPLFFEDNYGDFGIFDARLFPVIDEEGKCTHIIASANNITEKKKMEEHQLRIEKLESVGLLAGGIAHDFNNILTAIIGNTALAKMKVEKIINSEEEVKLLNLLHEIERASHQAKDLTQQLLTFAKGAQPILKTVSIGNLLIETANFALRGSNVRCNYNISQDLWPVEVDEGQICQVIHNLVVNADHSMSAGGVVTILAQNIIIGQKDNMPLKNGEYVKLAIQDQGHGISEEHMDKIFDPYFSTKQMGTGLGLTTSYSVVRKHKGHITVESKTGVGTTFYIYLPASQKRVQDKLVRIQSALIGNGKVLVMDDEKMVRNVLSEMLAALGFEAVCVKDGFEAIETYTKAMGAPRPFDAVIMDLTIPGGLGGKDTIKRLLEIDSKVKAIVSSGYSKDPVMANYKKYGFLDVVAKPYDIEKLREVLNNVINDSHKQRRIKIIS